MESLPPASGSPASLARWKWLFLLLAAAAGVIFLKFFPWRQAMSSALEFIRGFGPWGPVLFILLYTVACVCFVPGSVLTLAGGVIYGPIWGALYVWIGSTLGATAAFLTGRFLAREWVARKIAKSPRLRALDDAVAAEGGKIVGLVRLTPIFPFVLVNFVFGVTRVSLRDYFFATALGMIPATVVFVYLGSLLGDLAQVGRGPVLPWPVKAGLAAASVVATVLLTRVAGRALRRRIRQPGES